MRIKPSPVAPAFVVRSVVWPEVPTYAVVRLIENGGEDVAWFFNERDAIEYQQFLDSKRVKPTLDGK